MFYTSRHVFPPNTSVFLKMISQYCSTAVGLVKRLHRHVTPVDNSMHLEKESKQTEGQNYEHYTSHIVQLFKSVVSVL